MIYQWQAFRDLGHNFTIYTTGNYLAMQGGYNNVLRSASALSQPLTAYNAIQDQYLWQAGVSHPISKIKGLTLTFGPRWEGVRARNLLGNDLGFRRPGFAISAEPGFIYARGGQMLQASIGKAIYRDRTKSVPDQILGTHGDASFADYVWLLSYSYRLPGGPHDGALIAMRLVALVVLTSAAAVCADAPKADLTLKDAGGQKVRLRDLRGKPVVLNFWATWCGPCNAEMPMLVEMEKQYRASGVAFIGASLDDSKSRAKIPAFVTAHGISFPIWYGATGDDLDHLKLGPAVPATAFIDAEGRIVARILGQARPEEVKERLDWLIGDPSVPAPAPVVKHLP